MNLESEEPDDAPLGQEDVLIEATREDPRAPSAWRARLDVGRLQLEGGELSDALRQLPGVVVRRQGGAGSPQTLSVRGVSGQQVKVLLDGVALNPAAGGGVDLSLLPPGLLTGAEVYRGGSGARFGNGAIGGALLLRPALPSDGWRLDLSAGLGSPGVKRFGAAASAGARRVQGLLSVDLFQSDGDFRFEDAQGTPLTRLNADVSRLGALGSLRWRPDDRTEVALTEMWVASDRGQPGPAEFQASLDAARARDQRNTMSLNASRRDLWSAPEAALDGRLTLGWRSAQRHYRNPDRLLQSAVPYDTTTDEDAVSLEANASLYAWASLAAHLNAELTQAQLRRRERVDLNLNARERFGRGSSALALSLEWLLAQDRLSILPALRLENVQGFALQASPALGARFEVSESWALMGNVARAWRAPGFDELFLRAEFLEGDPDLRPESAISADLGIRWSPLRQLSVEAVAFWVDIDELILFLPVSATLYRASNTGSAVSRGVEASLNAAPWRWLRVSGAFTFNETFLRAPPQDPLPGRPLWTASGELRVVRPLIEVFARAQGRSRIFLDNFGNLSNDPALFIDVGATASPLDDLTISVLARNLLDERQAVDTLQSPQPGWTASAQLTWRPAGTW